MSAAPGTPKSPKSPKAEKTKLEVLQDQCTEVEKELVTLKTEAAASQEKLDKMQGECDAFMQEANAERQGFERQLKDQKGFTQMTLKTQGEILTQKDEEAKDLETAAEEARVSEAAAKVAEKEALQKVDECEAERDAGVTDLEQDVKADEESVKTAEADAALKVQKLEEGAQKRMEKLVKDITQARVDLDEEVSASKDAEVKRAEAAAAESEKRRANLTKQQDKLQELLDKRKEVTPKVETSSKTRRELEEECILLSSRYDIVDSTGTATEHKLLEEIAALEDRLTTAKKPSEKELKLNEEVKSLERDLVDAQLARDILDAQMRSEVEEVQNSVTTKQEEVAKKIAGARLGISESRSEYSDALNKAGAQQTKLRTAAQKAKEMRQEAEEMADQLKSDVNSAKAKLLVYEMEGAPGAKKAKKK